MVRCKFLCSKRFVSVGKWLKARKGNNCICFKTESSCNLWVKPNNSLERLQAWRGPESLQGAEISSNVWFFLFVSNQQIHTWACRPICDMTLNSNVQRQNHSLQTHYHFIWLKVGTILYMLTLINPRCFCLFVCKIMFLWHIIFILQSKFDFKTKVFHL